MEFFRFSDFGAFSDSVVSEIFATNPHTIALAGGSLSRIFPDISKSLLPHSEIFPSDERGVPLKNEHSNSGKIHHFFEKSGAHIYNFDFPDGNKISTDFEKKQFDIAVLGVGPDGHFASVFPGNPEIFASEKIVEKTNAPDSFSIRNRITFCPKILFNAKKVIFVLMGSEKAKIFQELQNPTRSYEDFPAHFFQKHPNCSVFWSEK